MNAYFPGPRIAIVLLLFCLALLLPACNSRAKQNEKLQKEWNAKCKEAADLLAGISDPASAKAAEPKIRQALEQMSKVNETLDKTYDPEDVSGSEAERMAAAVGQGIPEMQRLMTESLRISKIPGVTEALGDTWKMLPASMILEAQGAARRK